MIRIKTIVPMLAIITFPFYGSLSSQDDSLQKWKDEIVNTEKAFAEMAKTKGIAAAFLEFAAEDAVLKQEETLFIGKEAIRKSFEQQPTQGVNLTWSPDFVDVSASGDLGYTYGYYSMSFQGPDGKVIERKGVFHTVWKRQSDGTWKFVWD